MLPPVALTRRIFTNTFPSRSEHQNQKQRQRHPHNNNIQSLLTFTASSSSFFPFRTSSSTISKSPLPLTSRTPMSDNLRRRTKTLVPSTSKTTTVPTTLPSHERPRVNRSIKIITQAALDEQHRRDRKLPSILTGARGAILAIATHLLIAAVFLKISEGWALLDALYFAVVIATTVGYGDITPVRPLSKIFVAVYAIVSVAIIANLLQNLVERFAVAQTDIATSARSVVLGTSSSSTIPTSDSTSTDLIVATRLAVARAKSRLSATIVMFVGTCLSGIILYKYFLGESLIDVIYFLCISMTTVGLGDIHPKTHVGKGFATVWLVLTSLGFANILSQFADLKLKEREHETASKILSGNIADKMFSEIDGDNDETLSEAEYLGYIVCKMGKVSPDDVRSILLRFRELDSDASGFITKKDIDVATKKQT